MRVYLVGYMGCGKSTIGKKLANRFSMKFVDTDTLFEEKYKVSITDFFKKYDETLFRKLEQVILQETLKYENTIIATGGGMPCFFDNMDVINTSGLSIYLEIDAKSVLHRLQNSNVKRPILLTIPEEELTSFIEKQMEHRAIFYSKAHVKHPSKNLNLNELEEKIIAYINNTK